MTAILDEAKRFFTSESWAFDAVEGRAILRLAYAGKSDRFTCYAQAKEEQQRLVFYALAPASIAAALRPAVAEYLMRVNGELAVGSFELDFDDGVLRCRTSIDVEGGALDQALVKNVVLSNVVTMDNYWPGVKAVLAGVAPARALEQCRV